MQTSVQTQASENLTPIYIMTQLNHDASFEITYKILFRNLKDELARISSDREIRLSIQSKKVHKYIEDLKIAHYPTISNRSPIVGELYFLHQTALVLAKYNDEVLKLSNQKFRSRVLFPCLLNLLMRKLPNARSFLQGTIRSIYYEIKRKSNGIIVAHTNSFYMDEDVIKQDVLLEFLGNGLKKFNPLDIENIPAFYKKAFRQVFFFYFKREHRIHTTYSTFWNIDSVLDNLIHTPTRLSIYRDVLYSLQTKKFFEKSPTLGQLSYNFSIFQNVIVNNELQDIYFSLSSNSFALNNNQYKLTKVYNDDLLDSELITRIRKLPTIYKLLKCVHILNPKGRPFNEKMIKPEMVKSAVLEELMHPFRNLFADRYIYGILERISSNFVNSILSGEYINILTLSKFRIQQVSFINQIRKFVQICLDESLNEERNG